MKQTNQSPMETFTVNTHHAYLNNDIVIESDGLVKILDAITGQTYQVNGKLTIRLSAGRHLLMSDNHEEEIFIEDAIKLGGSKRKNAFVFDDNPWVFVTTQDRLYASNTKTHEEKLEYGLTPDEIVPVCNGSEELFRFKTYDDYAIFNVRTGRMVFQYTGHIFSNGHLVIFKNKNGGEVYDYLRGETIVRFDKQYAEGKKFYFVKDKRLYALDVDSSHVDEISCAGEVNDDDLLTGDYLLKLSCDRSYEKRYSFFSLEDTELNEVPCETTIQSPYYIESFMGESARHFDKAKDELYDFIKACRDINQAHDNVSSLCLGFKVTGIEKYVEDDKHMIKIQGELVSYPVCGISVPFVATGQVDKGIDLFKRTVSLPLKEDKSDESHETNSVNFHLDKNETISGQSASGNRLVTREGNSLFVHDIEKGEKQQILQDVFDTSYFTNAYFASNGTTVFLQDSDKNISCLGLDDKEAKSFDVEGFTLARYEGYNGYKPEVSLGDNRTSVWRDPVTLQLIPKEDMSYHVFKSPDGQYCADTTKKTVLYNRLTKSEISAKDVDALKEKYNWDVDATKEEKAIIIERRKALAENSSQEDLFGKVKEEVTYLHSIDDKEERNEKIETSMKRMIDYYITNDSDFASLIIDRLDYVNYRKTEEGSEEKSVLIGRNVRYLNYVSFSYDSKYLCFAAKMDRDRFRNSQLGVFEILELETGTVVNRVEEVDGKELWAVWMAMFSKKGDVAFYDSKANAYLMRPADNYTKTLEAPGKSLLCFSPSGNYIACSDQKYKDYTHHPNENWGHQPSGNVYILSVDDFPNCLEQYNDLGAGVAGVANSAGCVSSAAFSQDESRLLVVGNDGVVVVRNLRKTGIDNINTNDSDYWHVPVLEDDYGSSYGKYAGSYAQDVMGYSDDAIDDAFEGDPDAYWNID